jgi:hypothetical protein
VIIVRQELGFVVKSATAPTGFLDDSPGTTATTVGLGGDVVNLTTMTVIEVTCPGTVPLSLVGLHDRGLHRDSGWCLACSVVWSGWLVGGW